MAPTAFGCVGVLVRVHGAAPVLLPEERPIGRAALTLSDEGIDVVFGDQVKAGRIWGLRARPGGWEKAEGVPLVAVHDRFASQTYPDEFALIVNETGSIPFGNPVALTNLCRDKVLTQQWLAERGFEMPEIETRPARFLDAVERWGAAFAKPQFGALGKGVRCVRPGETIAEHVVGAVDGVEEPVFLQRAIEPPVGWAGVSLRLLTQREPNGSWSVASWVMRRSRNDPVVNVARGAQVCDARSELSVEVLDRVEMRTRAIAELLSTHPDSGALVELGVDLVLDSMYQPHLVEVNSRPRGRLEALADADPERYSAAHTQACARPIRRLWALYGATSSH